MSEMIKKMKFSSIDDTDESLKSKSGNVKFGLNEGFLAEIKFNPNAGRDGAAADAVDIAVLVGERQLNRRLYDVTRVYDKSGNEINDEENEQFIKIYNQNMTQIMGVIVHAVKSVGVSQETIDKALKMEVDSFTEWAKIITALVPDGFEKKPIDVFLEYQWNIKSDQDRTYLELPKNMKGGNFLVPHIKPIVSWHVEKEWIETENDNEISMKGLRYVDSAGNIHPFKRNESFMESNKAIQQFDKPVSQIMSDTKKSTW